MSDGQKIAAARDKFFSDNPRACDVSTLIDSKPNPYLKNRIEVAFIAGCNETSHRPDISDLQATITDKTEMIEALAGDIELLQQQLADVKQQAEDRGCNKCPGCKHGERGTCCGSIWTESCAKKAETNED